MRDQDESALHSDSIIDVWVTTILKLMMKRQLHTRRVQESKVELMHGYGVWITKRLLDEAISSSQSNATKLTQNLLSVFFSNVTLASSSAYGTGKHAALDKNILSAIIGCVQLCHTVAKSALIDAINDKCANYYRRKKNPNMNLVIICSAAFYEYYFFGIFWIHTF